MTWIEETRAELTGVVDNLRAETRLALDTESDPFHRYYEKVCLVQLSTPHEDVVIDPLAVGLPDPIRALLEDPARTFVAHGADFDLRSLRRSFEVSIGRIFDTLIASSFVGLHGLGLKALLEVKLGVVIHKTEQRSDWGRRPLSAEQRRYATQDTRHLLELASVLEAELATKGRVDWMTEECEALRLRCLEPQPPKAFDPEAWRKLKGASALGAKGQQALRGMFLWREAVAQRVDKPTFRVFANEMLVALAAEIERHGLPPPPALGRSKLVPRNADARALHAAVAEALAGPPVPPVARIDRDAAAAPLDTASKARLDRLRDARKAWAESLGLDAGFLVSGAVLERLAREPPVSLDTLATVRGMTAWRIEAIGREIVGILST